MDLFDSKYYALNKKLFVLCGIWPYQKRRVRVQIMIFFLIVVVLAVILQNAKLITSEYDIALVAEVFTDEGLVFTSFGKQFTCSMKVEKVKDMIERMKANWKFFNSAADHKIVRESAEEGRKFTLLYTLYAYTSVSLTVLAVATMPLLDIFLSFNSSDSRMLLFPANYFIDEDKYFYPITAHMCFTALVVLSPIIAADTMYVCLMYHGHSLFKLTSRRFEHAFDKYGPDHGSDNSKVNETSVNIGEAVKCHLNATKFVDDINDVFGMCFFIGLIPVILTISLSLFCIAMFFGTIDGMVKPMVTYMTIIFILSVVFYPAQKLLDCSSNISFKAYSGQWYAAPCKEQTLLLPIIQRGFKPSGIVLGNMFVLSQETFAWMIQSSMTYFTALLSLH